VGLLKFIGRAHGEVLLAEELVGVSEHCHVLAVQLIAPTLVTTGTILSDDNQGHRFGSDLLALHL
jgi:hypothetical protein